MLKGVAKAQRSQEVKWNKQNKARNEGVFEGRSRLCHSIFGRGHYKEPPQSVESWPNNTARYTNHDHAGRASCLVEHNTTNQPTSLNNYHFGLKINGYQYVIGEQINRCLSASNNCTTGEYCTYPKTTIAAWYRQKQFDNIWHQKGIAGWLVFSTQTLQNQKTISSIPGSVESKI